MNLSIPTFLISTESLLKRELLIFLCMAASLEKKKSKKYQIEMADFNVFDKSRHFSKIINSVLEKLQHIEITHKGLTFKPFLRLAKSGKMIDITWNDAVIAIIAESHQFLQVDSEQLIKLKIVPAILLHLQVVKTSYAISRKKMDKIFPLSIGKDKLRQAIGLASDSYNRNSELKRKIVKVINLVNEVGKSQITILKVKKDKIKYLITPGTVEKIKKNVLKTVDIATQCEIKEIQKFKKLNTQVDQIQLSFDTKDKQSLTLEMLESLHQENSGAVKEIWENWDYLTKEISPNFKQREILNILQKHSIERFRDAVKVCKHSSVKVAKGWIISGLNNQSWDFSHQLKLIEDHYEKTEKINEVIMNDNILLKKIEIDDAIHQKIRNDYKKWLLLLSNDEKNFAEKESLKIINQNLLNDRKTYKYDISNADEFWKDVEDKCINHWMKHNELSYMYFSEKWKKETHLDEKGLISFIVNASGEVVFETKNYLTNI